MTADDDGMTVSNTATGALVRRFRAALGDGAGFSVSPDGRWIAAGIGTGVQLFRCRLCSDQDELTASERRKFAGSWRG